MKLVFATLLVSVFLVGSSIAGASPVSSRAQIAAEVNGTVDFDDLPAGCVDSEQFNFGCGQPYQSLGLTMNVQFPVTVDIGSDSGGVSARSAIISSTGNANASLSSFSTSDRRQSDSSTRS